MEKSIVDTGIEDTLGSLESQVKAAARAVSRLEQHRLAIEDIGSVPTFWSNNMDFWGLTHEQTIKVLKHFPGKYIKTYKEKTINYKLLLTKDSYIEINGAEPPGGCAIVEEQVEVPETIVPAHSKTVYKIQCKPMDPETDSTPMTSEPAEPSTLIAPPVFVEDVTDFVTSQGFSVPSSADDPNKEMSKPTSPSLSGESEQGTYEREEREKRALFNAWVATRDPDSGGEGDI